MALSKSEQSKAQLEVSLEQHMTLLRSSGLESTFIDEGMERAKAQAAARLKQSSELITLTVSPVNKVTSVQKTKTSKHPNRSLSAPLRK